MFFITEKSEETTFNFSQNYVSFIIYNKMVVYNKNLLNDSSN